MILISHRGNIDSIQKNRENTHSYIQEALDKGYDVEIDVWRQNNQLFLGHDGPELAVELSWLNKHGHGLWIHTKNFDALNYLISHDLKVFFHEKEKHTIINNCNMIWSHDLTEANSNSIIPLLSRHHMHFHEMFKVAGICSDFIGLYK